VPKKRKSEKKEERNERWITIVIHSALNVGKQRFPHTLKKIK
jgi:hypothetical protein